MIRAIRKFLVWVIFKVIPPDYFQREIITRKIELNKDFVEIGLNSEFTSTASVFNMQHAPNKIKIGEGTTVEGELLIFKYGGQITIGSNSYLGKNSLIWSGERVDIGDNVLISHNVNISDTTAHEFDHIERAERFKSLRVDGFPVEKASIETSPIVIEDYVWINPYVIILKGIKIGKGAVVAAGSVVTKDVSPFTMVAGNPAKVVKEIDQHITVS